MRWACPQCLFTDTDHWSLHGVDLLYKCTFLARRPLSNAGFGFSFAWVFCPHTPPATPLPDSFLIVLVIDHLKSTIKNSRKYFCNICNSNRICSRFYVATTRGQFLDMRRSCDHTHGTSMNRQTDGQLCMFMMATTIYAHCTLILYT